MDMGENEGMWEIKSTTCLIGFRNPRIGVGNSWIGCLTSCIGVVRAISGIVH